MKNLVLICCLIIIFISCSKHKNEEIDPTPIPEPVITNDTIAKTKTDTVITDTVERPTGELGHLYLIQYTDSLGNDLLNTTYNKSKIRIYRDSELKEEYNRFTIMHRDYYGWYLCVYRPYKKEECDSVIVSDVNYFYTTVYIKLSEIDLDTLQMVECVGFDKALYTPYEKCFYNSDSIKDDFLTIIK